MSIIDHGHSAGREHPVTPPGSRPRPGAGRGRRVWRAGLAAVIAAVLVNCVIAVIAAAALGISSAFRPMQLPAVAFLTTIGVVAGVVVFRVLMWRARQPMRIFTLLVLIAVPVSWLADLAIYLRPHQFPHTTGGAVLVLAVLHATTAVITVAALNAWAGDRAPSGRVGA